MEATLIQELKKWIPEERILLQELLSSHTTFRIGGPADVFLEVASEDEISAVLPVLLSFHVPYFVLGRGSNLLADDDGYHGVILHIGSRMQHIVLDGDLVTAESGVTLAGLAGFLKKEGLSGFQFASGIPGTLGGAVYMNAGAYGREMRDCVVSVRSMSPDGSIRETQSDSLGFGYRTSRFQSDPAVILSAMMRFTPDDPEKIQKEMDELLEKRSSRQPLDKPSAGSVFKRPEGNYAGTLIEGCGLKGYRIGGACVSLKHAGFIVNTGGASSDDVIRLIRHIRKTVFEQTGVLLEPELRLLKESGLVQIDAL